MTRSDRVKETTAQFAAWREAQQLEADARMPTLFDEPTMDEAIASVAVNAGVEWMATADQAIRRAAQQHAEITADEVRALLDDEPHDWRALGSAIQNAARDGVIERVPSEFRISARPETHSRPLAVWRSLIFEGTP